MGQEPIAHAESNGRFWREAVDSFPTEEGGIRPECMNRLTFASEAAGSAPCSSDLMIRYGIMRHGVFRLRAFPT